MITTIETKAEQLQKGYFERGSGPIEILILGSCRTIAYLSYLVRWNESIGNNRFTIRRIDPCDWYEVGMASVFANDQTMARILSVVQNTRIFIHEYLCHYSVFNTDKNAEDNIYKFGMSAPVDISIPNWNDVMVLENDWTDYSAQTPENYIEIGEAGIVKFCEICTKTSFTEFGILFHDTWRQIRYFWRPNHTSAEFTKAIFSLMVSKFLELPMPQDYWDAISQEDLFRDPHTTVTQRDVDGYKLQWR